MKIIEQNLQLLAQKHDRVTCATKQSEQDSKDTDATNSCRRNVQVKLFCILDFNIINKRSKQFDKKCLTGAHSPGRGHPRGSKVVPLNSWGRVSY